MKYHRNAHVASYDSHKLANILKLGLTVRILSRFHKDFYAFKFIIIFLVKLNCKLMF